METASTYKGLDLRKVHIDDLSEIFPDKPTVIIDPEKELSDEELRILELYTYAETYNLYDLQQRIEILFASQLAAIL